jgi:hypothetical protein
MKLTQLVLAGEGLSKLTAEEQTFLVLAGQLSNDLTILHKLVTSSFREPPQELEHKANMVLVAVLLKTLAAKLYQGWELIHNAFDGAQVGRAKWLRTNKQLQKRFRIIRKYFEKENIIEIIRNKFAAHYDTDAVASTLPGILQQVGFEMIYGSTVGNAFYVSSEVVTWCTILGTTEDGEFARRMEERANEVAAKAGEFLELVNAVAAAFCTHVVRDLGGRLEERGHALVNAVGPRQAVLPLFLEPAAADAQPAERSQ